MTSPEAVRAWLTALRADAAQAPSSGLSPGGMALVLHDALDALEAELDRALAEPGDAWPTATFVAARTVASAPLEWLALLLGRGTRVTLKRPRGVPGLSVWWAGHAHAVGLPLTVTDDRDAVVGADLVVVMGDDSTVEAVRASAPHAHLLGFGHRASIGWWPAHADVGATADALARAAAAHDGRGCLSPALCFTTAAPSDILGPLADAMTRAQQAWPRGACAPVELASIRTRAALARASGGRVEAGDAWQIHTVAPALARPVSLPRAVQIVPVSGPEEVEHHVTHWRTSLSTVGLAPGARCPITLDATQRTAPLGLLQAPPLRRAHDGVDLVDAARRP